MYIGVFGEVIISFFNKLFSRTPDTPRYAPAKNPINFEVLITLSITRYFFLWN